MSDPTRIMRVTEELAKLRKRTGLSIDAFAKEIGFKGGSSYQRYEDRNRFKAKYISRDLAERMMGLVGRGDPPILSSDILRLAGIEQMQSIRRPFKGKKGIDQYLVSSEEMHLYMPVIGTVQAGHWKEIDELDQVGTGVYLPVARDKTLPEGSVYAYRVLGESINKVARNGEYLICVDVEVAGAPVLGDLVIVERTRDQGSFIELSAKRLQRLADGTLGLMPESTDPRYQKPLQPAHDGDNGTDVKVKIKAIVIMHVGALHRLARFT